MRYILRNQNKIGAALGSLVLHRIIKSLNVGFKEGVEFHRCHGDEYDSVLINDIGHTVNMIAFYVIRKTFDTYTLAFKEFIG